MSQYANIKLCALTVKTCDRASAGGFYGISNQEHDLEARLHLLARTISIAQGLLVQIPKTTLIVFMAPEFFFRGGPDGVYDSNFIEPFERVREWSNEFLNRIEFDNWIFCLGTIPFIKEKEQHDSSKYFSQRRLRDKDWHKVYNTAFVFRYTGFRFEDRLLEQSPIPAIAKSPFRFIEKLSVAEGVDFDVRLVRIARAEAKQIRRATHNLNPRELSEQTILSASLEINGWLSHFFMFEDLCDIVGSPIVFNLEICQDARTRGLLRRRSPYFLLSNSPNLPPGPQQIPGGVKIQFVTAAGLIPINFAPLISKNGLCLIVDGGPMMGSEIRRNHGSYEAPFLRTISSSFEYEGEEASRRPIVHPLDLPDFKEFFGPNHHAALQIHETFALP